jgi:hypothetical protein
MPEPTDLGTICSALEHFSIPAALCSIEDNKLVVWNQLFQKGTGLSEDELLQASLSSLILLDETYGGSILENGHPERIVRFVPCVLKNSLLNEWVPGRALKRSDGLLLALLGLPVGDVAFEGFIHGHLIGREAERNRTRQLLHDVLSSKLLIASLVAHEIYQSLSAKGSEEAKELAKVTKLLQGIIDDIVRDFAGSDMQAESIPERETASLNRLLESPRQSFDQ